MWYSTHSTGIKQFDEDHLKIDSIIKDVARATEPVTENELLGELYNAVTAHLKNKEGAPNFDYSHEEQLRDSFFLQRLRGKISERENGQLSKLNLIRDLHQMLADHVFYNIMKRKKRDDS